MRMRQLAIMSHLQLVVPLGILALQERGGPSREDWSSLGDVADRLPELGEEQLLFGGPNAQELLTLLARALTILAFVPGGVEFSDVRWDAATAPMGRRV